MSYRLIVILCTNKQDYVKWINDNIKMIATAKIAPVIAPISEGSSTTSILRPEVIADDSTLIVRTHDYMQLDEEIRINTEVELCIKTYHPDMLQKEEYMNIGLYSCDNVYSRLNVGRFECKIVHTGEGIMVTGKFVAEDHEVVHFTAADLTVVGLASDVPMIALVGPIMMSNGVML